MILSVDEDSRGTGEEVEVNSTLVQIVPLKHGALPAGAAEANMMTWCVSGAVDHAADLQLSLRLLRSSAQAVTEPCLVLPRAPGATVLSVVSNGALGPWTW